MSFNSDVADSPDTRSLGSDLLIPTDYTVLPDVRSNPNRKTALTRWKKKVNEIYHQQPKHWKPQMVKRKSSSFQLGRSESSEKRDSISHPRSHRRTTFSSAEILTPGRRRSRGPKRLSSTESLTPVHRQSHGRRRFGSSYLRQRVSRSDSSSSADSQTRIHRHSAVGILFREGLRSHEITSELDISRRGDLDLELTLEKWWVHQATPAHKRIVLLLFLLMAFTLGHLIGGIVRLAIEDLAINPYLCESPECQLVANDILSKMNPVADPCTDFFLFSCGTLWNNSRLDSDPGREDAWPLITDQIQYDFTQSKTIGSMLRERDPLVLTYHQACMEINLRNGLRLAPYFFFVSSFNLNHAERNCGLVGCYLPETMWRLFGQNLLVQKLFSSQIDIVEQTFSIGIKRSTTVHSILKFGFAAELAVIQGALTYVAEEGMRELARTRYQYQTDWGDASKIEAYAKLFICAELNLFPYQHHGQIGPVVWNRFNDTGNITTLCKFHQPTGIITDLTGRVYTSLLWSDFLQDTAIYQSVAPNVTQLENVEFYFYDYLNHWIGSFVPKILPILRDREDRFHRLSESNWTMELDGVFGNYDLTVRFLQWRIIREYGFNLDERLDRIMWPITRNLVECNWINSCIWTLFFDIPIQTQRLFLDEIPDERIDSMARLFNNYERSIEKMLKNFTFPKFLNPSNDSESVDLAKRAFASIQVVWPRKYEFVDTVRIATTESLRTVNFEEGQTVYFYSILLRKILHASHLTSLFVGFDSDVLWELTKEVRDANINRPVILTCEGTRTATEMVMPIGTYEPPYFGTNFPAVDLGGVGMYTMTKYAQFVVKDGMYHAFSIQNSSEPFCADDISFENSVQEINDYANATEDMAVNRFAKGLNSYLWRILLPGQQEDISFNTLTKDVNNLYSDQLSLQLALKLTYEVHEELIRQNTIFGKMVLPGLEKYNARQLLFMQSAARKCEMFSAKKYDHMLNYGPIPPQVSINLMAANSIEFSAAFKCQNGTLMNPLQKFNLYE